MLLITSAPFTGKPEDWNRGWNTIQNERITPLGPQQSDATSTTSGLAKLIPKKNDVVRYKNSSDSEWVVGKVISRAGKRTAKFGKNQYCVNIQPTGQSSAVCVDLKKVDEWECVADVIEDVCVALVSKVNHKDDICVAAKEKELKSFHELEYMN